MKIIWIKGSKGPKLIKKMAEHALETGRRPLLVDFATGERALPLALGMEDMVVYDLYDYLNDEASLYQTIVEGEKVDLVAASIRPQKHVLSNEDFPRIEALGEGYDLMLFYGEEVQALGLDLKACTVEDNIRLGEEEISEESLLSLVEEEREQEEPTSPLASQTRNTSGPSRKKSGLLRRILAFFRKS